jgi:VCBS repeat-containing protein
MDSRFPNLRRRLPRGLALVGATALALAAAGPGLAAPPGPSRIDLPVGWAPEGITAGPGTTVFVGSLTAQGIYQADVRTGEGSVIDGTQGTFGVGVEYDATNNRIWVAGGPTGQVKVLDASSGELLETYSFSPAGFLNDHVVTDDAVYVTDSSFAWLDVIPLGVGGALPDPGDAFMLQLSDNFELVGAFNLNGIVEARGWLIGVQTEAGKLWRIDPDTGDATEIALPAGVNVGFGDGLEMHGRWLYVVQNQLERVEVFSLGAGLTSASLVDTLTAAPDDLDVPTTAAWLAGGFYVVNARFGTNPAGADFWFQRLS